MAEKQDPIQALFTREQNLLVDDGFSERAMRRLKRRWWIRVLSLVSASGAGFTIFLLSTLKMASLSQFDHSLISAFLGQSLDGLFTTQVNLFLQITVICYVLCATTAMLVQSVTRMNQARPQKL
ncbi:MAG: hypothetical protein ACFHXK_09190 [bacterium]